MMNEVFLDTIPFQADFEQLAKQLHVRPNSPFRDELHSFISQAQAIARLKVFYKIAYIEQNEVDTLLIDGIRFHSRVLCVNLAEVHRVFAYVVTCGVELAAWRDQQEDILMQFWADTVMEAAVRAATEALLHDLSERFQTGKVAVMNPGSLKDWPITEQRPFFQLLGEGARRTGVVLSDSMLMSPAKSVTGLIFETESGYVNCQLCPRSACPNRRAEYQPGLMDERYSANS